MQKAKAQGQAIRERESFFESLGFNDTQDVENSTTTIGGDDLLRDSYRNSAEGLAMLNELAEQLIRRRRAG